MCVCACEMACFFACALVNWFCMRRLIVRALR